MRLLMAVSADGFLCRSDSDDMSWTGRMDKLVFRTLTGVGGVCAAGRVTWNLMPRLEGRQLIPLSRRNYTLHRFEDEHPDGWLLGGPSVAMAALQFGLVREFHRCLVKGSYLHTGVPAAKLGSLPLPAMSTDYGDVVLDVVRLGPRK